MAAGLALCHQGNPSGLAGQKLMPWTGNNCQNCSQEQKTSSLPLLLSSKDDL